MVGNNARGRKRQVMKKISDQKLNERVQSAVGHFWNVRSRQAVKQQESGKGDQGLRGAVTGGAQMDGFISLFADLIVAAGMPEEDIYTKKRLLDLPGFFRPTKEWDLLVVSKGRLLVAIEGKSQVGPSFGNNFNNRTEEAMGSALDIWTAFRESAFNHAVRPWLGYLFLLEDCPQSQRPVKVREPHFEVFPEFREASYAQRYELFCRKLVMERHYEATAFLLSEKASGLSGGHSEPAADLSFAHFAKSLMAHVGVYAE